MSPSIGAGPFGTRDVIEENLGWPDPEPLHDAPGVGGHVCFSDERVDIEVDGADEPRAHMRGS